MEYEDYLIREANDGPPADWSDSPVEYCNKCEHPAEECVCDGLYPTKPILIDTAHADRQEMINNLSGVGMGRESEANSCPQPAQTLPDTWEAIEAQLDFWAEMDRQYWQHRKEKAYAAWFKRTYGIKMEDNI